MKLVKKLEEKLKAEAIKKLEKGKPNWDVPHTLTAVHWVRQLIKKEGGNEKILVSAMYLHDTGYPVLKKGYNYEDLMESKKKHALRGANFAKKILKKIGGYTEKEIKEIVYLVKTHDKHKDLNTLHKQLVFEADGLAMLDAERVTPNLDKKNYLKFLDNYFAHERGMEKWNTPTGKKNVKILLRKARVYANKLK